jgi:hypothetical protein
LLHSTSMSSSKRTSLALAMQKVVGSSPIIRSSSSDPPETAGFR